MTESALLQTPVSPAPAPGHLFGSFAAGDAQFSATNRARVAVRVLRAGHGTAPVLGDGVPPERALHHGRSPPSPERRLGRARGRDRRLRATAVPVVLRRLGRPLR